MSVPRQEVQPKPPEEWLHPDFDPCDGERPPLQDELDVAHPSQTLALEIDDLRVEDMALE